MRWLGLRLRIILALVAAVAAACWVLTVTTTGWAAEDHLQRLGTTVQTQAGQDADWVLRAVTRTPTAHTFEDLYLGLEKPSVGDDLVTEAAIIPIPSVAAGVQPQLAHQYAFLNSMTELKDKVPGCLTPTGGARLEDPTRAPESYQSWSQPCGHYVFGYSLVQAPDLAAVPYWLAVRAVDLASTDDPVPDLRATLATYSVSIVLGALGLAGILAAMVAGPLSRSREMAEAVASGRLDVRLPVHGRDEVSRMSAAVNSMADRLTGQISELEQANETQQRFVSDVAHELRTPTAALLASAEALEHPETRDEAAVLIAPQLRRLAGL
ncbi:MAG TPA: HAMP domain-containing protein, partial [Propionicimonas sp.]|uniref:HAMP domain-containing protein n=1 Tax=Propionicimonas sp. TaxID=1955623 RepID=UPI002F3E3BC7